MNSCQLSVASLLQHSSKTPFALSLSKGILASNVHDRDSKAQELLRAASVDTVRSGCDADAIDGIVPQVVVAPRSTDELSRTLSFANEEGLAVAPRGGGTQLSIGNRMRRLDVVVDMSGLNRVVEHNAADLTLVVEAGITLASLRAALAVEGQFLPLDAPCPNAPQLVARSQPASADR